MTTPTETIHLRKRYAGEVSCGVTGPVRITEVLSETTCPRCRHDGDPVPRTRALRVVEAHAEALAENAEREATLTLKTATLTTPERNRLARIASIDEQIAELQARRAALVNPPFKTGDRVVVADEPGTVWTVTRFDPIDPRRVSLCSGNRDQFNVPASELSRIEAS